jgi:hypothetical protein
MHDTGGIGCGIVAATAACRQQSAGKTGCQQNTQISSFHKINFMSNIYMVVWYSNA